MLTTESLIRNQSDVIHAAFYTSVPTPHVRPALECLMHNPVFALEFAGPDGIAPADNMARGRLIYTALLGRLLVPDFAPGEPKPHETERQTSYRREYVEPIHAVQLHLLRLEADPKVDTLVKPFVIGSTHIFRGMLLSRTTGEALEPHYAYFEENIQTAMQLVKAKQ